MKKNSFFNRFTPKEPKFFPLLKQMSEVLLIASDMLIDCVQRSNPQERVDLYKQIKEQERLGDKLFQQIFNELGNTFITPFDREDIHHLAGYIDDVTDGINSSAKRIAIYNPKEISKIALDLALLIKQAAECIHNVIDQLEVLRRRPEQIMERCSELHDIENKADDVYETYITKLFAEEKDPIELIKAKEIMYELEKTTDAAEHVGKLIRTIIVKYA